MKDSRVTPIVCEMTYGTPDADILIQTTLLTVFYFYPRDFYKKNGKANNN